MMTGRVTKLRVTQRISILVSHFPDPFPPPQVERADPEKAIVKGTAAITEEGPVALKLKNGELECCLHQIVIMQFNIRLALKGTFRHALRPWCVKMSRN